MKATPAQEIESSKHRVKKQWLKPDVEIISVESGFFPGNFEGTKTFTITGHVVKNTYHS